MIVKCKNCGHDVCTEYKTCWFCDAPIDASNVEPSDVTPQIAASRQKQGSQFIEGHRYIIIINTTGGQKVGTGRCIKRHMKGSLIPVPGANPLEKRQLVVDFEMDMMIIQNIEVGLNVDGDEATSGQFLIESRNGDISDLY